jgi:hypothetical protein
MFASSAQRCCVSCLLALVGCSDSSLSISLDIPKPYDALVRSARLQIHLLKERARPGQSTQPSQTSQSPESVTCESFAFNKKSVQLTTLAGEFGITREAPLIQISSIPTAGPKWLVASGLDENDRRIVAGCKQVEDVDSARVVVISLVPITRVEAKNPWTQTEPIPATVELEVRDVLNNAVPGERLHWSYERPEKRANMDTQPIDPSGQAQLAIERPDRPGPQRLTIRTRWSDTPLTLNGFYPPRTLFERFFSAPPSNPFGSTRLVSGRFGRDGAPAAAVFAPQPVKGDQGKIDYQVLVVSRRDDTLVGDSISIVEKNRFLNRPEIVVVQDGNRDKLIAITDLEWIEVGWDVSGLTRTAIPFAAKTGLSTTRTALAVGTCGASGDRDRVLAEVLNLQSVSRLAVLDEKGQLATSAFSQPGTWKDAPILVSSGCADVDGRPRRVLIYRFGQNVELAVEHQGGLLKTGWNTVVTSIAFSSTDHALLGADSSLESGNAIGRFKLTTTSGRLELVRDWSIAAPLTPGAITSGDFDGDKTTTDIFSTLLVHQNAVIQEPSIHPFVVVSPADNSKPALTGLGPQIQGNDVQVLAVDFDGDNVSEVVVATKQALRVWSFLEHAKTP